MERLAIEGRNDSYPYPFFSPADPSLRGHRATHRCCRAPAFCYTSMWLLISCCNCYLWQALMVMCKMLIIFIVRIGMYPEIQLYPTKDDISNNSDMVDVQSISDDEVVRLVSSWHPYTKLLECTNQTDHASGERIWLMTTHWVEGITQNNGEPLIGVRMELGSTSGSETVLAPARIRSLTVTRWNALEGQYSPQKIETPSDWEAAKIHLVSNCHYLIKFAMHPMLHFSQEIVVPVFERVFTDTHHPVRQFLSPHAHFALTVNECVLMGSKSVLNGPDSCFLWDVQPLLRTEVQKLFDSDLIRSPVDRAAQRVPYSFGLDRSFPPAIRTVYEAFQTIVRNTCLRQITVDEAHDFFVRIVDHHRLNLPANLPRTPESVALVLADFCFKCSVEHSWDHYALGRLPVAQQPMDICQSPFYRMQENQSSHARTHTWSHPKQACYRECFEFWTRSCLYESRLIQVKYGFESDAHGKQESDRFRHTLARAIPEEMHSHICQSIEF